PATNDHPTRRGPDRRRRGDADLPRPGRPRRRGPCRTARSAAARRRQPGPAPRPTPRPARRRSACRPEPARQERSLSRVDDGGDDRRRHVILLEEGLTLTLHPRDPGLVLVEPSGPLEEAA